MNSICWITLWLIRNKGRRNDLKEIYGEEKLIDGLIENAVSCHDPKQGVFEHMDCTIIANWGNEGKTVIKICDFNEVVNIKLAPISAENTKTL